jgi:hypothetical protein
MHVGINQGYNMKKMEKIYGDESCNVLLTAMKACADDEEKGLYYWLENTPQTSMIQLIVDKLNEMGYDIQKVKKDEKDSKVIRI